MAAPPAGWGAAPIPGAFPYSPGYPVRPPAPTSGSRPADLHALSNVTIAAVLALIGAALGLVVLFGTNVSSFLSVSTVGSGTSLSLGLTGLYLIAITGGIGILLSIIELVFYRQAFHILAPHDSRFSTPSKLVLLGLIAIVIIVAALGFVLYLVYQSILCAGLAPITTACLNLSLLLLVLGVAGVAAVLALIGWIGLLIGIWRLGSRYDETLFKVGAVLLIFPLLNVIATILILVAARSARDKIAAGSATPSFG